MAKSTLSITFVQADKTVVVAGTVGVRESIDVTVVGGAALIADGLVLKLQDKGNMGLTVPIAQLATWTTSGLNAVGVLSLNTTEAIAAFADVRNCGFKTFNLLLFTTGAPTLACNGVMSVMNFPSSVTTAPTTLSQQVQLTALADRMTEVEAQLLVTPTYTDFDGLETMPMTTDKQRNAVIAAIINALQGN